MVHLLAMRLLLLAFAVRSCSAAMAAWWMPGGPQVIRQNETTGNIMYSNCASNGSSPVVFANDPPLEFALVRKPRQGTALSGQGYSSFWASIFYQDVDGNIVNYVAVCDPTTGQFADRGTTVVSASGNGPEPLKGTGLSSVPSVGSQGLNLYYHTSEMEIHQYTYANNVNNNKWAYGGVISRERPLTTIMNAMATESRNKSIIYPKNKDNLQVSRLNQISSWHMESFPRPLSGNYSQTLNTTNSTFYPLDLERPINFTLPAYDGTQKGLGMSTDKQYSRSVFYVGTDRRLYQISNINYLWRIMTNQTENLWPLADEPGAELAIAWDFFTSQVRIYYDVRGALTELRFDEDGIWKPARAVATTADVAAKEAARDPGSSGAKSGSSSTRPLSLGAKVGIAVGATVSALVLAGAVASVLARFVRRRNRQAAERAATKPSATDDVPSSPMTSTSGGEEESVEALTPELVGGKLAHEMEEQLRAQEMEEQLRTHEMITTSNVPELAEGRAVSRSSTRSAGDRGSQ